MASEPSWSEYTHVVAGIVWNDEHNKVLISWRRPKEWSAGKWEFPGGKWQSNESLFQVTLYRELKEELGIFADAAILFDEYEFQYIDCKPIFLHVYEVSNYSGVATGLEGQVIAWVSVRNLCCYDMIDGDWRIVAGLWRSTL